MGFPGLVGADPYTRVWMGDSLWVELFGRPWLPGLQAIIVANTYLSGGLILLKWVMLALVAAAIIVFARAQWRRFGPLATAVTTAILLADPDLLWVSAAPYQEGLFYLGLSLGLLGLTSKNQAKTRGVLLGLSCLICLATRYEGLLWAAALAFVQTRRSTSRATLVGWWGLAVAVPASIYAYLLRDTGVGIESPSVALPQTDAWTHLQFVLDYVFGSTAALWVVPAAIGTAVAYQKRPRREAIALDLYTAGFVAVYLATAPYMPAGNRRFHIPILIWLALRAGIGLAALVPTHAGRRRQYIVSACILMGTAAATLRTGATAQQQLHTSAERHLSPARVGAICQQLIPTNRGLLMAWTPADYHGYPSKISMRIAAQLTRPRARVVFAPEFESWSASSQKHYLETTAGGVLLRRRKDDSAGIRARHRQIESLLHQLFGSRLARARVAGGYELYTWIGEERPSHAELPVELHPLGIPGLRAIGGDLGNIRLEDPRWYPGHWNRNFQLQLKAPTSEASTIELEFSTSATRSAIGFDLTQTPSGGTLQLAIDGTMVATYQLSSSIPRPLAVRENVELAAGTHRVTLTLTPGPEGRQLAISRIYLID